MITRYDVVDGSIEAKPKGKYVEYGAFLFVLETFLSMNPTLSTLKFVLYQISLDEGLRVLKEFDEIYSVVEKLVEQKQLEKSGSK